MDNIWLSLNIADIIKDARLEIVKSEYFDLPYFPKEIVKEKEKKEGKESGSQGDRERKRKDKKGIW